MEESTTAETFEDVAREISEQPQSDEDTTAESTTNETSQSDETGSTDPEEDKSEDAEIKEWAEKKGLDLNDPVAVAKAAREAEKAFHSKSTEASKLKKAMGDQGKEAGESDVEAETYETLNRLKVAEFYQENPQARELDTVMAEILDEKPWLAQDLESLYAVAQTKTAAIKTAEARQQGQREERARIAQAQAAGAPKASATGKESSKKITEADIEKMSLKEYQELKASGWSPYSDL